MFLGDCNKILKELMDAESEGRIPKWQGKNLPRKEEVEIIICGNNSVLTFLTLLGYHPKLLIALGPPCQGFSGMNRYKESDVSKRSRGLILTALSFLDFYRPKYFVLVSLKL